MSCANIICGGTYVSAPSHLNNFDLDVTPNSELEDANAPYDRQTDQLDKYSPS